MKSAADVVTISKESENLFKQAMQLQQNGDIKKAEELYLKLLEQEQNNPIVLNNIAILSLEQGNFERAMIFSNQAVNAQPNYYQAIHTLAISLARQGNLDQADICFKQALSINPSFKQSILSRVGLLINGNKVAELRAFLENLQNNSNFDEIFWNELVIILIKSKFYKEAIECCEAGQKQFPNSIGLEYNKAVGLSNANQHNKALKALKKCQKLDKKNPDIYLEIVKNQILIDRLDKAKETLDQLINIHPKYSHAYRNYGNILQMQGKMKEASKMFRKALEIEPSCALSWASLTSINKYKEKNEDVNKIKQALQNESLSELNLSHLNFALGKIFADIKDYDSAFEYYKKANDLRHNLALGKTSFNPTEEYHKRTLWFKENLTKEFFEQRKNFGFKNKTPVFILGMPRSGTTLVEQIISSHQDVSAAGELNYIAQMSIDNNPEYSFIPRYLFDLSSEKCEELGKAHVQRLIELFGKNKRISDKMPINISFIGLISLVLPEAKIIYCRRHPLDNALSCYFQNFTESNVYSFKQEEIVTHIKDNDLLGKHWQEVSNNPIHEIAYENLISNQEAESRKLIDFLELDWQDACLNFHESSHSAKTASSWQVRQPIYKSSYGKYKNYEKHISILIDGLSDLAKDYEAKIA